MRTTLTIDDDVLAAVHERARAGHTTAGAVLSDLARQALTSRNESDGEDEFLGFRPFARRGNIITNEMINSIRDEIGY